MQVKSQRDLKNFLAQFQESIGKALSNNVAKVTKETMSRHVKDDVYKVYPDPTMYKRTGELANVDNIECNLINDSTLVVENVRSDGDRNVAEIVETGKGYMYDFRYSNVPRPFIENTREDLRSTGAHVDALVRGMKQQGIKLERK